MRLNQIRDFVSIVETGSIRAAARSLGVSQPAMTKSIRQLEEELRVQLIQRTTRGVKPTTAGTAFLARARVVQAELRKAEADLAQLAGHRSGSVAFGVAPAAAFLLVPEAFDRFRSEWPAARVRIVEGVIHGLLPLVKDATLDFLVAAGHAGKLDQSIKFRPLFRARLVIAGRRGHPLRDAKSLRELADASWLMFQAPGWRGAMLPRAFAAAGLPLPTSIVHCESYAAALALLAKTDTLGLLTRQYLAEPFVSSVVQEIAVDMPPLMIVMGMYARAEAPLSPAAAAMARAVAAAGRKLVRTD